MTTNASQTHDHESGHGKDHGHDHGSGDSSGTGHGHGHGVAADADRRWLSIALALISTFLVGEVVVGIVAHSLALLSDAAHMLT
ncbi:MAG: cobalt-zinc-cadmium efflux system protein, partial [Pseudonocardiales bacterium]|nr:cobalt-zinc-cadmium efflux system protein [Pseudonocardiales bacterium]